MARGASAEPSPGTAEGRAGRALRPQGRRLHGAICPQANEFTAPDEWTGTISSQSDVDLFKMQLAPGKTLSATLTPPAGSDFDLYIYNSNFTLIGKSEKGAGLVDQVSVTNNGTSTFTRYLMIRYWSGASTTNRYKLRLGW